MRVAALTFALQRGVQAAGVLAGPRPAALLWLSRAFYHFTHFTLKYAAPFWGASLLDLGAYDAGSVGPQRGTTTVLWSLLRCGAQPLLALVPLQAPHLPSVERLFRSGRWQEREVGELLGVFFTQKRDRRVLFTIPVVYAAPLRRHVPVMGFFELVRGAGTGGLGWRHVSWLG